MRTFFRVFVALACFGFQVAFAYMGYNLDGWDYSESFDRKCFDKGQGQIGVNQCMSDSFSKHDEELNALYRHLVSVLADADTLRNSQKAWLKHRDFECNLRLSGIDEKGSMWRFQVDSCRLDMTLKRIKDLKHLESNLNCNGCPVTK